MRCKFWSFLVVLQISSTVPALAEEANVLNDLSKSHPGWILDRHFYAPPSIGQAATTILEAPTSMTYSDISAYIRATLSSDPTTDDCLPSERFLPANGDPQATP